MAEIKNFIVNEIGNIGERDDYGTPASIIHLAMKIVNPENKDGVWSDLANFRGNYLVEVAKAHPHSPNIHGYEIDSNACLIAKIRLYLSGAEKFDIFCTDVLRANPIDYDDFAFIDIPHNLPFNESDKHEITINNRYLYNRPLSKTCNWIFVDRLVQSLSKTGRGVAIILDSCLSNNLDSFERKEFIDKNKIEGVIRLPSSVFTYFDMPVSMLIVNKCKTTDEIKFLDASSMKSNGRRFAEVDYNLIAEKYFSDDAVIVPKSEVVKNNYSLNTRLYTDVKGITIDNPETLSNVLEDIFRGIQIPASEIDDLSSNNEKSTYKLVSVGDIQDGTFDLSKLQKIKNTDKYNRYLIRKDDVLLTAKSTKIKSAIVEDLGDDQILATGGLIVIRCDNNKVNPIYIKTFLDSSIGMKILESIQTGNSIISINVPALSRIQFPNIDRQIQNRIATRFLIKLDQLRLARKRVNELERDITSIFDSNIMR